MPSNRLVVAFPATGFVLAEHSMRHPDAEAMLTLDATEMDGARPTFRCTARLTGFPPSGLTAMLAALAGRYGPQDFSPEHRDGSTWVRLRIPKDRLEAPAAHLLLRFQTRLNEPWLLLRAGVATMVAEVQDDPLGEPAATQVQALFDSAGIPVTLAHLQDGQQWTVQRRGAAVQAARTAFSH